MRRINANKLRRRIKIEYLTKILDPFGQPVEGWETFAEVWASIEPISGREYWASNQIQSAVTHRIRIRYLEGLDPSMRINFNGRKFEIESIKNIEERNSEMEILAVEQGLVPDENLLPDAGVGEVDAPLIIKDYRFSQLTDDNILGDSKEPLGDSSDPW